MSVDQSVCILNTQGFLHVSLSNLLKMLNITLNCFLNASLIFAVCIFLFICSKQCRTGRYQLFQSKISKVLQTEILAGWQCRLASEIILYTFAFFNWRFEANWSETGSSPKLFLSSCPHPEAYKALFRSGLSSPDPPFTLDCLHPHQSPYIHTFSQFK